MSLQKGFLQTKITLESLNIDKKKLILGILLWLALSFSIYSILYGVRETFRYTSFWYNNEDFLVLTTKENYLYNFFSGCLGGILAFTVISNHWIRRPSTFKNISKYRKAGIYHDKVSFSSYFIFWFSKLAIFFGTISCSMGVFQIFSLYPDYSVLLVLIVLTLFLHQWLTLRLVFRNSISGWMIGTFAAIIATSSVFATVNLIPYQKLNESVLKNTISHNLSIQLPTLSNVSHVMKKSLVCNIYLGFSKQHSDSVPQLMVKNFENTINTIQVRDVARFIDYQKSILDEFERDEIICRLFIDKQVKMKFVNALTTELSRANARNVQFVSTDGMSNSLSSSVGLRKRLRYAGNDPLWVPQIKNEFEATLELSIRDNRITYNQSESEMKEVKEIAKTFFYKHAANGVIEFSVDDESSFEVYIVFCDQFVSAIKELRNNWALKNFNSRYSGVESYDSAQRSVDNLAHMQYPLNLIEED